MHWTDGLNRKPTKDDYDAHFACMPVYPSLPKGEEPSEPILLGFPNLNTGIIDYPVGVDPNGPFIKYESGAGIYWPPLGFEENRQIARAEIEKFHERLDRLHKELDQGRS